jgi:undecaprenyl-diphosphatase
LEEIFKAIILGIIQGISEYLPISSTAHLRIIPSFFGWKDIGAAYTAVIQVGTMIAIIIYFWRDLVQMASAIITSFKNRGFKDRKEVKLFFYICIGTVPILIFGYLFKDLIRNEFRSMYIMAIMLVVFSLVIFIAEKFSKKNRNADDLNSFDALFIGFFQAIALIPGTSRSGSTISGGFFRNMTREGAARYSFLLSIPAILISGLYELYSERGVLISSGDSLISLIIATIVSGIIGYLSIWFLLSYLKKHSMMIFIIYRVIFGVLIIILLSTNIISN